MSVVMARRRAERLRTEVASGVDSVVERNKLRAAAEKAAQAEKEAATFARLTEEYFERHASKHKAERSIK